MRIIGGKYKGRRIDPPSGFTARPTTDFAREGLFNILTHRIDFEGLTVLDLFAGTGSISYEFASRGAGMIHLVDMDAKHIAGIKRIMKDAGMTNLRPIHIDVKRYLVTCHTHYDIVFADPPYDLPWLKDLPDLVLGSSILTSEGLFILEHPKSLSFANHKFFFEHRNYGSVNFSFFRPSE